MKSIEDRFARLDRLNERFNGLKPLAERLEAVDMMGARTSQLAGVFSASQPVGTAAR